MTSASQQILEIADELYALPLEEFTPARDARAKELKDDKELSAGGQGAEEAVRRGLGGRTCFVRREAEQVEQVLAVGDGAARGPGRAWTAPSCGR